MRKQQCIPVGCVPPAVVAVPGESPPGTPQTRYPPEQAPSGPGTPLGASTPPDKAPPGSKHPPDLAPPLWTESQTPLNIQPCPNFVAGGNKELDTIQLTSLEASLTKHPDFL